jgi:tRNA(Phe) wybutosine-synthesizing methylase Tyw3
MAEAGTVAMADRRALLTEREREIVSGEADDVTDEYRYQTVSRIRSRLQRLEDDIEALEKHGGLAEELREIVCENHQVSEE